MRVLSTALASVVAAPVSHHRPIWPPSGPRLLCCGAEDVRADRGSCGKSSSGRSYRTCQTLFVLAPCCHSTTVTGSATAHLPQASALQLPDFLNSQLFSLNSFLFTYSLLSSSPIHYLSCQISTSLIYPPLLPTSPPTSERLGPHLFLGSQKAIVPHIFAISGPGPAQPLLKRLIDINFHQTIV